MKKGNMVMVVIMYFSCPILAQDSTLPISPRSIFRKNYLHLGINTLGTKLDNQLSPKQNLYAGNYGASTGYQLEMGHVFYFLNRNTHPKLNVGLDWTIFSIGFNQLKGWERYASAQTASTTETSGSKLSVAISSKIGPVLSFNAFEKFVVDARVQVGYQARYNSMSYGDEAATESRYLQLGRNTVDGLAIGVVPGIGITIRRKVLGLSVDYSAAKISTPFYAEDPGGIAYGGYKDVKTNELQIKISLHF